VDDTIPLQPPVEQYLTAPEKALRDRFVAQYLVDYDAYKACIRIGYTPPFAKEFSNRFLNEQYVLTKIAETEGTKGEVKPDEEAEKKRIIAGLWREANNLGYGSSQSARVAALAKLSAFYGMDAPTKSKTELTGADGQPLNAGVFVVPGLMTTEDWERQAQAQQEALTRPEVATPALVKVA
jgi:hypothetical protein